VIERSVLPDTSGAWLADFIRVSDWVASHSEPCDPATAIAFCHRLDQKSTPPGSK